MAFWLAAFSGGCLSTATIIRPASSEGTPVKLSPDERAKLIEAIERRLERFGIKPLPNLDEAREISEESADGAFRLITAFIITGHGPDNTGVEVSVLENKRDATAAVLVESRAWPFSKAFADSVIREVRLALADALPNARVVVKQRTLVDLR